MTDADLAVIGGGPVGLAVAIEARLAGLEVVVVEPRPAPIDKACGEGVMPGALRALQRLGIEPAGRPLHGVAYVAGERRAEHRFAGDPGRGVRRTTLHEALSARAAGLGARVLAGRVAAIRQDACGIVLAGDGLDGLRAPWAVAADGLHSRARRLLGVEASGSGAPGGAAGASGVLAASGAGEVAGEETGPAASGASRRGRASSRDRRRFGLRRHVAVEPWSELVEVHWSTDSEGPPFEAYVTPVGPAEVGIALLGPPGLGFEAALERLPGLADRVAGAPLLGDVRGAGPLRQRATRRAVGRVLLAGDASGYVDALTGEGLRVGLEHARAAVRAVLDADPGGYEREWRRVTRDFRMLTAGLVAAARSPLRSRIVPAAERLPSLYGAIVERLAR